MAKILIFKRKEQTEGTIKLRFRIRDGRSVQIFHPSDIEADVKALKKLNDDGTRKSGVSIYDVELSERIKEEIDYLTKAYDLMKEKGYDLTAEVLEKTYLEIKNPVQAEREEGHTLLQELKKYLDDAVKLNFVGDLRLKTLRIVYSGLERYLIIKGRSKILVKEFTEKDVLDFQDFLFDEYKYAPRHKKLYEDSITRNIPTKRRASNTVATRMKALQSMFRGIDTDYNPFDKLTRKYRTAITKEEYEEPICLNREEFFKIFTTPVPDSLAETKDAFLLQCAFGCRISDFISLSMDNVSVNDDGIPYIHYLPKKTIMREVQIDEYAAGLHAVGSQAVERYHNNGLRSRFVLMCAAFSQPIYKVDENLNVL